jgi:aromatic-L-amino-acid decarboxylase
MTPEEFRLAGHQLIDWIAEYRSTLAERPVQPSVRPGDIRRALPSEPPGDIDPFDALLDDLDRIIVPGLTQIQHPRNFAWFPSNASLSSVLGDLTSSGLGALGISWQSAPALTELEEVVCDWLRQLVGLSDAWVGAIHDTASTACLVALLAARERASDHGQERGGLQAAAQPLVVYASREAHSSVTKAALLAGFGAANVHLVESDPGTFALLPDALAQAMAEDEEGGKRPAAVVASVGTTGTTAIDPVSDIVELAATRRLWVHVDAAMAGSAMLLEEFRPLWQGVEGADSLCWNPHKWLGTVLDTSLLYVRDPAHLQRVLSTNPSYLRSGVDGEATQLRDWGIPLGRRFRALKPWFQLRLDGVDNIKTRLRRDLDNARWLAEQVEAEPGWELMAPVTLQTVCVRHHPRQHPPPSGGPPTDPAAPDALDVHNLRWVGALNRGGAALLTPTQLTTGPWAVRVSIGAELTERDDVHFLWQLMRQAVEA